jgi:tetratricopeptide (TPR) repeat protein
MRSNLVGFTFCLCTLALPLTQQAAAQSPELPQPSPHARVEQRVGLSDFSVDYSSPAVKGRSIWGGLVAYDKPWRTGANAATKLTSSQDFMFGGKKVPAGTYALYTVPGKASWSVVLNSSVEAWGNDGYDTKKDIARIAAKPEATDNHERMTFAFADTTDDGTQLTLAWEKVRVRVPITVETKAQVKQNIDKSLADAWRPHFTSARYLLDNNGDLEQALGYIDQSIAIKPTWWNQWVRAQILSKKGKKPDAVASAEKAVQLGKGDRTFEGYFKADVTKAVADWKK